jgi:hypothetical protein
MGVAAVPDQQTEITEREVESKDLEKILEDREKAKGPKLEAAKKYKTLDQLAKDKLEELGYEDGDVLRIGRFKVTATAVPSRNVAFETDPTTRLTIGVLHPE